VRYLSRDFPLAGSTHANGCATSIELSAVSDRERLIAEKQFSTPEELAAMPATPIAREVRDPGGER
jgi:hypothetical protein